MILQTEAKIIDETAQGIQNISNSTQIDKYAL
jgi:hypothetical protein